MKSQSNTGEMVLRLAMQTRSLRAQLLHAQSRGRNLWLDMAKSYSWMTKQRSSSLLKPELPALQLS